MPIYEFYCGKCHMIFNFFARSINTDKQPMCPKCRKIKLDRCMSRFATPRHRGEEGESPLPDLDEAKMEKAMSLLSQEADHLDENDPRQAAQLMRRLSDMTGLTLGPGMEEALTRMEAGEDPDEVEAQMGDLMEGEEPFLFKEKGGKAPRSRPPAVDETLYDL